MTARRYSISVGDVQRIREKGCAACGSQDRVHIDHNHATGQVRGALCSDCNKALGLVKDNILTLRNLIQYIEVSEEGSPD